VVRIVLRIIAELAMAAHGDLTCKPETGRDQYKVCRSGTFNHLALAPTGQIANMLTATLRKRRSQAVGHLPYFLSLP
jgi:hypothetical protein